MASEEPLARIEAEFMEAVKRRDVDQALVALGVTDSDWSSYYRLFSELRLDYETLTECFLSRKDSVFPRHAPLAFSS